MYNFLSTLLFFPDWTNGFPSDFLILHFFVGAIFIPFLMISRRARNFDKKNPEAYLNGYKDFNKSTFFGYEEINWCKYILIYFMKENVDLTIFSPTAPLGIFIIFCGLIFSSIVFYIIYAVSTNKESLEDKKMRDKKNIIQKEKINRLFPKKK